MQLLQTLSIFAFGLLVSAVQSPPEELEIKTTYTPSDCTVKAQKGDPIKVHYVRLFFHTHVPRVESTTWLRPLPLAQTGKLFSDGKKFDSR
jgi:FK506-binding protein 2